MRIVAGCALYRAIGNERGGGLIVKREVSLLEAAVTCYTCTSCLGVHPIITVRDYLSAPRAEIKQKEKNKKLNNI